MTRQGMIFTPSYGVLPLQFLSCSVHFSPLKGLAYILSSEETLGPLSPSVFRVWDPQQRAILWVVTAVFYYLLPARLGCEQCVVDRNTCPFAYCL